MKDKWIKKQMELLARARAEGRSFTAEEQAEFDECQRQIDAGAQSDGGGTDTSGIEERSAPSSTEGNVSNLDTFPNGSTDTTQRTIAEERQRVSDIMALCRQTGMDPERYIKDGSTPDMVRSAAVAHLLQHGAPVISGVRDPDRDNFCDAARDALLMQAGVELKDPAQGAEEMRGMSVRDILIESMVRSGEGSASELLRRGRADLWDTAVRQFLSPTAEFPAILDNAIKKSIVQQYALVPCTFERWTSRGSLKDFKPSKEHEYALGGGDFYKVSEGGELKHSTLQTELLPTRKLDSYGTQFTMTREAFINDDIGFLSHMPAQYAGKAKRKINRQVYERIFENPATFDGAPIFDAAHKNLIAPGSAPSISVLMKMIQKMGMQTDQFGESIMVEPASIIVPVGWGMSLYQMLNTVEVDVEGIGSHAVNVLSTKYKGKIQVIEEGALNVLAGDNACPWFMAADPRVAKGVQVDYLNGVTTPTFRRSEKAGFLGFLWDIWLDWGISEVDYRGLLRNDGIPVNM